MRRVSLDFAFRAGIVDALGPNPLSDRRTNRPNLSWRALPWEAKQEDSKWRRTL